MLQMLLDNRNGNIFDVSELVTEVTWKTQRKGKAATLEFDCLKSKDVTFNNGDVISCKIAGVPIFYGYIFENGHTNDDDLSITAYDQIRYLLFNDTYVFTNKTASQIVTQIAQDFKLRLGNIENTGFVIPSLIEDNKKLLDIIYSALEKTLMSTGKTYVLYDDFGSLCLRDINNMKQDVVISDDSNLTEFDYSKSIDSDTYNKVKIVKDNKETKGRDVFIVQDSKTIAKWGLLQYFHKADENMNKAQITDMAEKTLKLRNRETKTLKIDVLGTDLKQDLKLRAGAGVYVQIKDLEYNQYFLIEDATHKFSNNEHTISLDLKVV